MNAMYILNLIQHYDTICLSSWLLSNFISLCWLVTLFASDLDVWRWGGGILVFLTNIFVIFTESILYAVYVNDLLTL